MNEDDEERQALLPLFTPSVLDSVPVYSIVLDVYDKIVVRVDTSLKYEQLKSPQIHSFMIRPLAAELKEDLSAATLYALMANMLQFNKESFNNAAMTGVSSTRAMICEILAVKLLKDFTDSDDLMNAMTYDFYPLANGDRDMQQVIPRWQRISTLELAIKAEAKKFLSHPVVVKILEDIWTGSVMFQSSMHKLHRARFVNEEEAISAGYGRRGPGVRYDYEDASLFKLSRLRVPRYRHWINMASFCCLLCLYVMVLMRQGSRFSAVELVFWIWSLGFILDEIVGFSDAGFTLYVMSLWNWFDLIILLLLSSYAGTLIASHLLPEHEQVLAHTARDLLATVAIFLFPRLFSILDGYEVFSYMVVSVRKMFLDLAVACLIIVILSSGFWVAFTMAFAREVFTAKKVAYDMMRILFGFTLIVWDTWPYYSVLGRIVLVFYLFVTHYLIITIMIAVLSNSFAAITANAHEEHQYLFAVNTITMIKSESSSLFSYAAPLNLLEWLIRPLYYILPLRNFLVLNRTVIKVTHLPVLFLIFIYERLHLRKLRAEQQKIQEAEQQRRQVLRRPATDGRSDEPLANKKVRKSRKTTRKNKERARPKVSNDDLLDEVFKRPYKGTIKVRPNIQLDEYGSVSMANNPGSVSMSKAMVSDYNSDPEQYDDFRHRTTTHDADSEFEDDDESNILPSAGATLFHTTKSRFGRPHHRRGSDSTIHNSTENVSGSAGRDDVQLTDNAGRHRLFSTTSSLARHGAGHNLALSPTRSTTSVLGRHFMQQNFQLHQQQQRLMRSDKRGRGEGSLRQRRSPRRLRRTGTVETFDHADNDDDDDDLDDDHDDDDYDNDSVLYKPRNNAPITGEEVQDMSRLIMRRMDTLEDGFKNMELLLSRLPELLQHLEQHRGEQNNKRNEETIKSTSTSATRTEQYQDDTCQ